MKQCDSRPRLLLGITGSVAAALMPEAVLWMRQNKMVESIDIVLSPTAATLVAARALEAISGGRVFVDSLKRSPNEPLHINLTEDVDVFLIMPATANVLAKAAQGIADDLVTSCILASTCPVLFVPSMKNRMWLKPAIQRAVATLRNDGYEIIEPEYGFSVSSGEREIGGIPDIESVFSRILGAVAAVCETPAGTTVCQAVK